MNWSAGGGAGVALSGMNDTLIVRRLQRLLLLLLVLRRLLLLINQVADAAALFLAPLDFGQGADDFLFVRDELEPLVLGAERVRAQRLEEGDVGGEVANGFSIDLVFDA